jgi:hypothetical protein
MKMLMRHRRSNDDLAKPRAGFTRRAFLGAAAALGSAALVRGALSKPRFSLAHLTVLGCAPPEVTHIAARAGYDFVSYRIIPMGLANEPNYLASKIVKLRDE